MLWWLAQTALTATALAAVVLLLCRWARPAPALRHALWLVVLLKLLSPLWLQSPWTVPEVEPVYEAAKPAVAEAASPAPAPPVLPPDGAPPKKAPPPKQPTAPCPAAPPPAVALTPQPPPPAPPAPPAPWPWREWLTWGLLGVWLAGSAVVAGLQTLRVGRLCVMAWRGQAPPAWLTERVAEWARVVGVRPPRVVVTPGVGSPFLACVGRPVLVVPEALLSGLPAEAWPGILVHELAHLRRRDHWVVWLELVANCLWWWFPVWWLVRRELRLSADLACDAWVVATAPDGRRAYAEALIEVSRVSSCVEPLPALAVAGPGRRSRTAWARRVFERRLVMILRERAPARLSLLAVLGVAVLAVVVLPAWLPGQKPPEKGAMPKPLEPEEALKKARADGKYQMLIAQIKDEAGYEANGAFKDLGLKSGAEVGNHKDAPRGHWVYVYPYYYVWRDLASAPKLNRDWGPEQATGEPDTNESGDIVTAWASATPDGQDEWLMLEYAEPVLPRSVMVHETFNPGALVRVTVFKLDGEEVEVWKGMDPTSPEDAKGVSVIPFKVDFKVNRVKLYIASTKVPGWNEIDAVGLKDDKGKVQWATSAHASSTFAEPARPVAPPPVSMIQEERIRKLEEEVRQLKMMLEEMKKKMDKDK